MSLRRLDSINPFTLRIKRTVRYWFFTKLFFWTGFLGLSILANEYLVVATALFICWFLISGLMYFVNHSRSVFTKRSFEDYADVREIGLLTQPYDRMLYLLKLIFWLDIFLWPANIPIKIIFYVSYRRFRKRIKQVRRMILDGVPAISDAEIENDPFYEFLIREGLYQKPKSNMSDDEALLFGRDEADAPPPDPDEI